MSLEDFTHSYIATALWSSTDDEGNPLDARFDEGDIAPDTLAKMHADCEAFYNARLCDIHCENAPHGKEGWHADALAGHDFWLTRCGHGAGFWDGDWPEPHATRLDDAAKAFGNVDLYVGDDGLIDA